MMFSVCLFLKHNLVIFITEKREDVNFLVKLGLSGEALPFDGVVAYFGMLINLRSK